MESYQNFNKNQILPIFTELKNAKNMSNDLINILTEYLNYLKQNNKIKGEYVENIKFKINRILNTKNENKLLGIKNSIFERLQNGISYKYKIKENLLFENPEKILINKLDFINNNLIVNKNIFFLSENETVINIKNIENILNDLDDILLQLNYFLDIVIKDVDHFNLFNKNYLNI